MNCDAVREALSSRLDGEAVETADTAVDAHIEACGECRRFALATATLHRALRVRPAEPVPDLTVAIMQRVAPATPARTFSRLSLVGLAVVLAAVSAPELLSRPAPHAHDLRHLAIYDVAIAGTFAYVALRPWVARSLFPVVGALGLLMAIGAAVDTFVGGGASLGEPHHLLQFIGIVFVGALARPPGPGWTARRRFARDTAPPLRGGSPTEEAPPRLTGVRQ